MSVSWIPSRRFLADLPRLMEVASLPGLAMAVVAEGKVVWTHALGVASTETRRPVRDDSLFEAASLSKPVFAYVVLKLVEEKRLDLDRPLTHYRRPEYLPDHPDIDRITARDVLRHSTGLPNWRGHPGDSLVPTFTPGARWGYSGEGYFWLQLVVERITGQGLEALMRERLFEPAGMPLSTFGWNETVGSRLVRGHQRLEDGRSRADLSLRPAWGERLLTVAARRGKPLAAWTYDDIRQALPEHIAGVSAEQLTLPDSLFPNAAGSLITSAPEYARFMTLILEHRKTAPWEISARQRAALLSRQMRCRADALYWGLGWGLEALPGGPWFFHTGNNGGRFRTLSVGDPPGRRALVVFTNGGGGDRIYQRIVRAATGRDLLEFLL